VDCETGYRPARDEMLGEDTSELDGAVSMSLSDPRESRNSLAKRAATARAEEEGCGWQARTAAQQSQVRSLSAEAAIHLDSVPRLGRPLSANLRSAVPSSQGCPGATEWAAERNCLSKKIGADRQRDQRSWRTRVPGRSLLRLLAVTIPAVAACCGTWRVHRLTSVPLSANECRCSVSQGSVQCSESSAQPRLRQSWCWV
jgi:hypothetical protein